MFFFDFNESTLRDSIAFETYVYNAIKLYLQEQNKTILIRESEDYDAILPEGIDEIEGPVYLEIKYFNSPGKNVYFQSIMSFSGRMNKVDNGNVLLILGTNVSEYSINSMKTIFCGRCNKNIEIWTLDVFNEKTKKYREEDFTEIKNPNTLVIDAAINKERDIQTEKSTRDLLINGLKNKYDNQEVVLFLGAGVSIESGIPLWGDLVNNLLAKMIVNRLKESKLSEEKLNKIISLASNNQEASSITQMRYIRSAFDTNEYNKLVHDALYSNNIKINSGLLKALSLLCAPTRTKVGIRGIVTYNFDDILEKRLKKDKIETVTIYDEHGESSPEKLSIFHVHGYMPHNKFDDIENPQLIFSEEDYHKVYTDAYCWSNIVQLNYLRENTCLFIGCSLNDPNLRRLLDVAARGTEKPKHYAIMKRPKIMNSKDIDKEDVLLYKQIDMGIKEKSFSSMGLNIIWVDEYKEIVDILKYIKK